MAGRGTRGRGQRGRGKRPVSMELSESSDIVPGIAVALGSESESSQGHPKHPRLGTELSVETAVGPQGGSGPPGQNLQVQSVGGESSGQQVQLLPASFIDAELMASYGGLSKTDLETLDLFFKLNTQYGSDNLVQGLLKFSYSLRVAADKYRDLYHGLNTTEYNLNLVHNAKSLVDRALEDAKAENSRLQSTVVELTKENGDLKGKLASLKVRLEKIQSENQNNSGLVTAQAVVISQQNETLDAEKKKLELTRQELEEFRTNSGKEVAKLNADLTSFRGIIDDLEKKAISMKGLFEKFTDPVTKKQLICPVIQNNGVIRSLGSIIDIWLKEADMGQCHAFRMYQCPVLKSFTMIAPVQIVETFNSLAASIGVDVDLPFHFSFKKDDGSWGRFPFHEQLELIARLCAVYNQRKNDSKPPEQRNVNIEEISFMIVMRPIAYGSGHRLECYGVMNKGGSKVDINVVFAEDWVSPFVGMDFTSGV